MVLGIEFGRGILHIETKSIPNNYINSIPNTAKKDVLRSIRAFRTVRYMDSTDTHATGPKITRKKLDNERPERQLKQKRHLLIGPVRSHLFGR